MKQPSVFAQLHTFCSFEERWKYCRARHRRLHALWATTDIFQLDFHSGREASPHFWRPATHKSNSWKHPADSSERKKTKAFSSCSSIQCRQRTGKSLGSHFQHQTDSRRCGLEALWAYARLFPSRRKSDGCAMALSISSFQEFVSSSGTSPSAAS